MAFPSLLFPFRGGKSKQQNRISRVQPVLENLEARTVPAAIPLVTISAPSEWADAPRNQIKVYPPATTFIGEQTHMVLTFDNASPVDVGYGPYIDLYVPKTGVDGGGAGVDDGISFASATYLGLPVVSTVITLTAAGVNHPYAVDVTGKPLKITPPPGFQEGDQLVVLQLPFGSFTNTQPQASIDVALDISNQADLGVALPLRAEGGFQYGNDPLNNPQTDPTIVGPATSSSITPQLFRVLKEYIGPEDETATGPNFPRQYKLRVDVANGQTLTNLQIQDILDSSMQFMQVDSVTGGIVSSSSLPSTVTPGGTLLETLSSVTGTTAVDDATVTFSFYVPYFDNASVPTVPVSGQPQSAVDNAQAEGDWTPIDPRDPAQHVISDPTAYTTRTLAERSLAIQKTVALSNDQSAPGYSPGDTVEYTLRIQVSDYFAFQNLLVSDILPDGLSVDGTFTPTLELHEHSVNSNLFFTGGTFTNTANPDGTNLLQFNVSQLLVNNGQDGLLLGGNIPAGGTGGPLPQSNPALQPGTIAFIKFRAKIDNTYQNIQPSGTDAVVPGDWLVNRATISGDTLNVANLAPTASNVTDNTYAEFKIVSLPNSKSVYAVNGNTGFSSPIQVVPGDTVTYRLTTTVPFSTFNDLHIHDFLPLPLYRVNELTTFNPVVSATPPAPGTISYAPGDTFHNLIGITPTFSLDPTANEIQFQYGDHNDPANQVSTIDLLLTVTVTDEPMADRLLLTNQFEKSEIDSVGNSLTANALVQVQVLTPSILGVRKGVVATSNPAGTFSPSQVSPTGVTFNAPGTAGPRFTGTITSANLGSTLNSNLSRVDAGDLTTFALSLTNTGSSPKGAFDVRFRDTIPAGFSIPSGGAGLNLRVTDGAGNPLPFITLGAGLFGTGPGDGLELVDASGQGSIAPGTNLDGTPINNGRNIVIITYDLVPDPTVEASKVYTNTITLFNYASVEGGPDYTTTDFTDIATVTMRDPSVTKTVVGTEIVGPGNGQFQGVIGELVTYTLSVRVPEGVTNNFRLTDTLDNGLAFVDIVSATSSVALAIPPGNLVPTVTSSGRIATFDFGTITNTDTNNAVDETIQVTFRAVVLNVVGNQSGTQLGNTAQIRWTNPNNGSNKTSSSTPSQKITVVEPALEINKTVSVNGHGGTGEANEPVSYAIKLTNPSALAAYEVDITDPLPFLAGSGSLILAPSVILNDSAGILPADYLQVTGDATNGYQLAYNPANTGSVPQYFDFPASLTRVITVTVNGTLAPYVPVGGFIKNTATTTWTSMDGDPGIRSIYNTNSTERTGADGVGGALNDYADRSTAGIQVPSDLTKSLVNTSEADTAGDQLAIGEIARYRLTFNIAQGATTNFQLRDNLPAGLQFLNDGTAMVALVSATGTAFTGGLATTSPLAQVAATNPATVTPTVPLSDLEISASASINDDTYGDGTDVFFKMGDLVNTDVDATQKEFVVVEFNALVLNVSANQAGSVLINNFNAFSSGSQVGVTSNDTTIQLVEPSVSVAKSTSTVNGDAGDLVTYTLLVVNATGDTVAPAHNIRLLDLLPADLQLDTGSVVVEQVSGVTTVINNSTSTSLDLEVVELLPGEGVKISYTAVVQNGVQPGQTVTNNASITYTSLPGTGTVANPTGSVTPGGSGAPNGQRDGSGGVNDYIGNSNVSFTINLPTLAKSILATSVPQTGQSQYQPGVEDVTPGELVVYAVTATLIEGTQKVAITDQLPASQVDFIGAWIGQIGSGMTNTAGLTTGTFFPITGSTLSVDFGTVTVPGDNDDTNNQIEILVYGRLKADNPANVSGAVVTNTATLDYGSVVKPTASVDFDVVEPKIFITKAVDKAQVDAGDIVTYTLVLGHTAASTATVFNTLVADVLATGLALVPGSVTVSDPAADVQSGNGPGDTTVSILVPEMALGQTVTITYKAVVRAVPNTTVKPGDAIPNTVNAEGSSVPTDEGRKTNDNANAVTTLNTNTLSGFVYHDVDGNRTFSTVAGDLPLAGVAVALNGTDNLGNPVTATTTTDANGFYQFINLPPGTYSITETQPATYVSNGEQPGSPFAVSSPALVENILQAFIPTGSNGVGQNFNFAEVLPGSLAGSVYSDLNNNGIREISEIGLPGVVMLLTGTDLYGRPVSTSLATDANGNYLFGGLLAGDYTVTETVQPAGYLDGKDTPGSLGGDNSVNDRISGITLPPAANGVQYNFGELLPASLTGQVYLDLNKNGVREPADLPIRNVTITLRGTDDLGNPVLLTTTTDPDGKYQFLDLRPGTYEVEQTQPPGYLQGETQAGSVGGTVPVPDLIQSVLLVPGTNAVSYDFTEFGKPADPVKPLLPPELPPIISKQDYLASSPDQSWVFTAPLQPHFENFAPNGQMGSAAFVVTGSGPGSGIVRVFDYGQDNERFRFQPYGTSAVGVRVAKGDVTGDGVPDFVTVPTGGFAAMVHVYDGNTGNLVRSFDAYPGYQGGLWVTTGDLDGDGVQEIVTATDTGVAPHVVAFNAGTGTPIHSFFAYAPAYLGGVRVAVGDLDGDGRGEIITAAGPGASPHIVYFDGLTAATLQSFYAFDPAYLGGVSIAAGDTNGDGLAEVVAGSGPNAGGGALYVFNGAGTMLNAKAVSDAVFGMDVGTQDINVDGVADILLSRNRGSNSLVNVLDGMTLADLDYFYADDPRFLGGISVA